MNPEQINQLLSLLKEIATGISQQQTYTITGAADWPMLVMMLGIVGSVIVVLGGAAWLDIRSKIEKPFAVVAAVDQAHKDSLKEHKADDAEEFKRIWENFEKCQDECCPPRMRQ